MYGNPRAMAMPGSPPGFWSTGDPGWTARGPTNWNGPSANDRTMPVFNGIGQALGLRHPHKANVMMLGHCSPARVWRVGQFDLTQTTGSPRDHMDDPTLVRTTHLSLADGRRHFKEMLMPGKIELDAIRGVRQQGLEDQPEVGLHVRF